MSAEKLSDLLPLPQGCRDPHAYQVFGLQDGEQDAAAISKAVKQTVAKLKSCKESTDPKLWNKAAKLVQQARAVLSDPDQKAQLDARFGIISLPDEPATPNSSDPLAGVLPAADPLAAMLPTADPMAPATSVPPPAPTGGPAPDVPAPVPSPITLAESGSPTIAVHEDDRAPGTRGTRRRRRRSPMGLLMFATFTLSMFAVIGILSYFLFFSDGELAISKSGDQIKISTKPEENTQPQVAPPGPIVRNAPPRDPIMGDFAEQFSPGPAAGRPSGLVSGMDNDPAMEPEMSTAEMTQTDTEMPMDVDPESTEPEPEPQPEPQPEPEPKPESAPEPELSEEMIDQAEEQLQQVEQLIRTAQWKAMKPAAEKTLQMPMNEDQKQRAEALHELADLATYYRGGIANAVADLNVGNDFEVADDFRVIVVEKGDDLLVVRFNERNRTFTFDEFPFSLAHRLASFAMPQTPGAKAAKAVYQAIAPKATEGHREESLDWLREIDPATEELDVKRTIETLESILQG